MEESKSGSADATALSSLNGCIKASKVTSVLNNDVKNYGKQNLFDGNQETCWNSDRGSPQFIAVKFNQTVRIKAIDIMFQGGFASKVCSEFLVSLLTVHL
jgi:hypothetical protein